MSLHPAAWTDPEQPLPADPGEQQAHALDVLLRGLRGMQTVQRPVAIEPLRSRELVNSYLEHVHGHAGGVAGWRFAVGARDSVSMVGVLVAGRPVAPATDQDGTLEVTRLCLLEGAPVNTASRLLGAACKAARALGYHTVQTWLLDGERGTAYRAAGFEPVRTSSGGRWTRKGKPRRDDERNADLPKVLWSRQLRAPAAKAEGGAA